MDINLVGVLVPFQKLGHPPHAPSPTSGSWENPRACRKGNPWPTSLNLSYFEYLAIWGTQKTTSSDRALLPGHGKLPLNLGNRMAGNHQANFQSHRVHGGRVPYNFYACIQTHRNVAGNSFTKWLVGISVRSQAAYVLRPLSSWLDG